ncbi:branched-chain amino acid ABC transporter permease [Lachnospiraceae bacterium ZAX-1]
MFSTSVTYYLLFVGTFILLVWSFYIPFRAGLLYNGTVYCMAIGGYVSAYVAKDFGIPFYIAVLITIAVGILMGFLPSLAFSRTSGIVTAIASQALIFIIQSIIRNLEFLGGANGMLSIPKAPNLLPFTALLILVIGILIFRLDHSRVGRAFEAIATDPVFAQTMGINVKWVTVFALTASSVIASLSGVVYAFNMRVIRPDTFGFSLLLSGTTMLFIGGRYTQFGALLSVPILWGLPGWMPTNFVKFTQIIYGALLILVLTLRPEGLITRKFIHKISLLFSRDEKQILKKGGNT